jgi:nitrogen fixation/metabolism regulation signal transduction histidine kinase
MLRRKLLTILFSVTALLVALALAALWSLHLMFSELEDLTRRDVALAEQSHQLATTLWEVELELYALQTGQQRHLDQLIDVVERMRTQTDALTGHLETSASGSMAVDLPEHMARFESHVAAMAVTRDPALLHFHQRSTLAVAGELRQHILTIDRSVYEHVQANHDRLTRHFRNLVIGLAVGFLLVINGSILLMTRSLEMVTRPIDRLVVAARELAAERFEYRVEARGDDEFAVLAGAFNGLAQQLQSNEQRKLEVLQQTARTLSHELNNAMAIIELQLRLLRREVPDGERQQKPLREIHQCLARMSGVVESFSRVRQIVLTDYLAGTKMLDLARSVELPDDTGARPGETEGSTRR